LSFYREQLSEYLSKLTIKEDRVLDVGGAANPVKNQVKKYNVKEYMILDNKAEQDLSEEWHIPDIVWNIDLDISKCYELENYKNYFDQIYMLEVMEYLKNPYQAFKNIYTLLKPRGIFIFSAPFIYPLHSPKEIDYTRYTKSKIISLLDDTGFTLLNLYPRMAKNPQLLKEFFIKEGMHMAKGEDHGIIGWIGEAIK